MSAKQSIKRQLHTTHVGSVGWEPHSSSTTTCAGKLDHELPVNYRGAHQPTAWPLPHAYAQPCHHGHLFSQLFGADQHDIAVGQCREKFVYKKPFPDEASALSASSIQHMWELLPGNCSAVLPRHSQERWVWCMCAPRLRACLHGGGGPHVGEVIRLGGVTRLSI